MTDLELIYKNVGKPLVVANAVGRFNDWFDILSL
jgi:hypothetical protein